MARYHRATITPTKEEAIAGWVPTQPWGPPADVPVDVIGAYRFDDPDGHVGMESFRARAGEELLHVPLTYRDEPLADGAATLICEMEHSTLGTRWVYDGLSDPMFVTMLAAGAMTGQGEALGMVVYDDRWYIAPTNVRIEGGGWTMERVAVDGFDVIVDDGASVVYRNDRFELRAWRRPIGGARPPMGLAASWEGQPEPVVLAVVSET